jgi:hypothetical protein
MDKGLLKMPNVSKIKFIMLDIRITSLSLGISKLLAGTGSLENFK